MAKISLLEKRFAELLSQLEAVAATKRYEGGSAYSGDFVDSELLTNWRTKARNLIVTACGDKSEHLKDFVKAEEYQSWSGNYPVLQQLRAVFLAAKEDYEGGYLSSVRSLVQAEVFNDELDQARSLLGSGYVVAAAVISGVVLETTLRQMCTDRGLACGKLDKMNADLAKAGCYNLMVQKRITALADIRNNAAHGNPTAFNAADVSDMVSYVERFVGDNV